MHYLEITLFVKPRKSVGHFLNRAAASLSPRLRPTEPRCAAAADEDEDEDEDDVVHFAETSAVTVH